MGDRVSHVPDLTSLHSTEFKFCDVILALNIRLGPRKNLLNKKSTTNT